jgi:hypothetical protein
VRKAASELSARVTRRTLQKPSVAHAAAASVVTWLDRSTAQLCETIMLCRCDSFALTYTLSDNTSVPVNTLRNTSFPKPCDRAAMHMRWKVDRSVLSSIDSIGALYPYRKPSYRAKLEDASAHAMTTQSIGKNCALYAAQDYTP